MVLIGIIVFIILVIAAVVLGAREDSQKDKPK